MTLSFSPAAPFPIESISFFGRSYDEYCRFFELDDRLLQGRRLLDVAAGPASFAAEAARRGLEVVAVDPLYGCTRTALEAHVQLDYARMFARVRSRPERFRLHSFRSFDEAERDRREAAERFLADYDACFVHGRYVGGALPKLPFTDRSFDVVLCAHLLFLHERQFDAGFHLAACRELLRVAKHEVRIHPLCGSDGRRYAGLDGLITSLRALGVFAEERAVDYEFFRGSASQLVLCPVPARVGAVCR